jgi:hypothetical protein
VHVWRHMVSNKCQVFTIHYDPNTRSSPVGCDATIRMMFVLAIMAGHSIHVVDVQGIFLNGEFENDEKIYMVIQRDSSGFTIPRRQFCCWVAHCMD